MCAHLRLGLVHILFALKAQKFLEPLHLGVAFVGGLNNSSRTFFPVSGSCIRFAGSGGSGGHTKVCFAGGPTVAQDEVASAKISNHAFRSLFGITFPFFVCGRNRVLGIGQFVPVLTGLVLGLGLSLAIFGEVFVHGHLGHKFGVGFTLVVPSNASTAETKDCGEDQSKDQAQVHGSPLTHSWNSA